MAKVRQGKSICCDTKRRFSSERCVENDSCHAIGSNVIVLTRTLRLLLASMLTIGMPGVSAAGGDADQAREWGSGEFHRSMDVDSELAHLTKELDLTEEQRERILPILVEHQRKEQALHQNTSLSSDDRRAQAHAISDETHKEIAPLLTDRQRQVVEAIQQRAHHGTMRGASATSGGG